MKNRRMIVMACGTALLLAAAVEVALRGRRREVQLLEVLAVAPVAEVLVKAVERNPVAIATAAFLNKAASLMGELWYNIH